MDYSLFYGTWIVTHTGPQSMDPVYQTIGITSGDKLEISQGEDSGTVSIAIIRESAVEGAPSESLYTATETDLGLSFTGGDNGTDEIIVQISYYTQDDGYTSLYATAVLSDPRSVGVWAAEADEEGEVEEGTDKSRRGPLRRR